MSTKEKIKSMPEDELFDWFCENARAHELINDKTAYSIRIGASSKALVADDTEVLFNKLKSETKK